MPEAFAVCREASVRVLGMRHYDVQLIGAMILNNNQIAEMRKNYEGGNYGYGHAKQALFELIIDQMAKEREIFDYYMDNTAELIKKLEEGEAKAREIGLEVLARVKEKIGF